MTISWIAGESAATTTVSLPGTAAAGDVAIAVAGRAHATAPSIPGGWNTLGTDSGGSGGSVHSQSAGWKILTAGDITAGNIGTWTNAAFVGVGVWRVTGTPSVGSSITQGANSTSVSFPAQSGLAATSWQVALGTHRSSGTNTLKDRSVTSYTNRSSGWVSENLGVWDSNAPTTGIGIQAAVVSNTSGNVGRTVELLDTTTSEHVLDCDPGAYTISGTATTTFRNVIFDPEAEFPPHINIYTINGGAIGLSVGSVLSLDAGAYIISGTDVTLEPTSTDIAGYVTLNAWWTGVGLSSVEPGENSYVLDLDIGAYVISGTDVTLSVMSVLALDPGAYVLSGTEVVLQTTTGSTLDLDVGAYVIAGTDVTFQTTASYSLSMDVGVYVISGTDVSLESTAGYTLALDPGAYVISGTDVAFQTTSSFEVICDAGAYLIDGTDCTLTVSQTLSCDPGSYVISGTDVEFMSEGDQEIVCEPGSYIIDGTDCTLTYSEAAALEHYYGWIAQRSPRVWIAKKVNSWL